MKKVFCVALTLFILSVAGVEAQVLIGGDENPHAGAILDLSQRSKNVADRGGLLLPCVNLTSDLSVFVLPLTGTDPNEKMEAKGMLVYNLGPNPVEGIYLWDGTQWRLFLAVN